MCARGVASARGVLESFVLIGALTALWRACGTVSEVVVLAAPLVRPAVAPLAVFCMCSLMSFLIGTSFGTAATMGVSIALAALVCAAARRMSAGQIASVCVLGFTPADPTVAELMSGGGVVSMVNVSLVVCLSSSFSGLFDGTGLLDGVRGLVEVARVAPVIVVRVDAHHGIEEPRAKKAARGRRRPSRDGSKTRGFRANRRTRGSRQGHSTGRRRTRRGRTRGQEARS